MHDATHPLPHRAVIIDEASMLDLPLFYNLVYLYFLHCSFADLLFVDHQGCSDVQLKAIKPECRVVLVGDCNQLLSVGPGAVLRDIIEANCVPTVCKSLYVWK